MSIQGLICFTSGTINGCSESNRPIIVYMNVLKDIWGVRKSFRHKNFQFKRCLFALATYFSANLSIYSWSSRI